MKALQKGKGIAYERVIVACCFLMIFVALGFGSSPRKLFMVAVPKALDLEYGPYSINDSMRYVSAAVVNLFFGALIARFGPRRLIAGGFISLIASMLVYSVAENLAVIYLGGVLLGVGVTLTGTTMASYAVNLWCRERKGTMMGIVLCANGLGGAAAMQVLSPVISADVFGYRDAYRLAAVIMAAAAIGILLFFRNAPEDEKTTIGAAKKQTKADGRTGVTLSQALRKPYFYAAAGCIFLTGMVLQSIVGADANHMDHAGLDKAYVALVLSIHSLVLSLSKFITGFLYDKKGLRKTMLICDGAAFLSILLLVCITDSAAGKAMALGYSVLAAMALPLETIMLPLITAELFGQRSYAQMLGIVSAVNTAGYSLGPPITNFVFDALGSYTPVFTVYLAIIVGITLCFMGVISAARRDRQREADAQVSC